MQNESTDADGRVQRYERRIATLQDHIQSIESNLRAAKTSMQLVIDDLTKSNDELTIQRNVAQARVADLETATVNIRSLLQGFVDELSRSNEALALERNALLAELKESEIRFQAIQGDHLKWHGLRSADRLIELDFPVRPRVRQGENTAGSQVFRNMIARGDSAYEQNLRDILGYAHKAHAIEAEASDPHEPSWINDWFPAFDALSVYGFLAKHNPKTYLEIGSGTSTKFARRAVKDFSLRTKIVSIDPFPRAEIDAICDKVVRLPLEDVDQTLFFDLDPNDVVLCDSSHRSFQNSDVTVFLTEIVPAIPVGVLLGIHDIFLPYDYPEDWLTRYYNEQYLLGCLLLGTEAIRIELPVRYCCRHERLRAVLGPVLKRLDARVNVDGGAFWFRLTRSLING